MFASSGAGDTHHSPGFVPATEATGAFGSRESPTSLSLSKNAEVALGFLARDFDQAFSEKRRLEDQVWDTCKFAFTAHSGTITLSVGIYQFSIDKRVDLIPAAVVLLSLNTVVGLFVMWLMLRLRVYFVRVARYINGQRKYYRTSAPQHFPGADFYTDPTRPYYLDWQSTQIWAALLVALLNSVSVGTLIYLARRTTTDRLIVSIAAFLVVVALQIGLTVAFLRLRERRDKTSDSIAGTSEVPSQP